jgi:hypothetical protein
MAKPLCVTKHYGYWVQVHSDYIDMLGGDHCAAVLLWIFEFSTNGEMRRKERAGETGDPWLEASVSSLADETNGLYSKRSIEDRLGWLKQLGFVSVKAGRRGTIHEYLFNGSLVDSCLDSRQVFSREVVRNFADGEDSSSAATSAATSAKTTENGGALNLKEEELRTKNLRDTPQSPSSEFCEPQQARRILVDKCKLKKLSPAERSNFDDTYDAQLTEEQVFEAGGQLSEWLKTATHKVSWVPVFLKDPTAWCSTAPIEIPVRRRPDKQQATGDGLSEPTPLVDAGPPPRDFPAEWNRLVPEFPYEWGRHAPVDALAIARMDDEFVARFDEICDLARKIRTAQGKEGEWLTFGWLLKLDKNMRPNWARMLMDLRGMANGKVKPGKEEKLDALAQARADLRRRAAEKGITYA